MRLQFKELFGDCGVSIGLAFFVLGEL